jgi:hypothetical protein
MRRDATWTEIRADVAAMGLGRSQAATTAIILRWLARRARTIDEFADLAAHSPFGTCTIAPAGIGAEVRMTKSAVAARQ